jgi:hypothetical protein
VTFSTPSSSRLVQEQGGSTSGKPINHSELLSALLLNKRRILGEIVMFLKYPRQSADLDPAAQEGGRVGPYGERPIVEPQQRLRTRSG